MATFRKRGSSWQVQIRTKGKPPVSCSFPTKSAAQAWVEGQKEGRRVPTSITLRNLLEQYAQLTESKVDRAFIKTFTSRCVCLDKPIAKLTSSDFLAYREAQLKVMKATSYNRSIKPILGAFRMAIEHQNFPRDIADCLKTTKLKAKATKRRVRFMRDAEERFYLHCSCPTLASVVVVLVESAMRSGELFMAEKSWLRDGCLYIPDYATKTKRPRTVALSPRALGAIDLMIAQSATDKIVPLSAGVLKNKFRRVRDSAGLGDLHLHDLRHESLSRMSESGVFGPAELMNQSGHTNLAQLGDYIHADPMLIRKKLVALGS